MDVISQNCFLLGKNEKINIDVDNSKASEIFSMFQHVAGASERLSFNTYIVNILICV